MLQCSMCLLVSHLPSRSILHELQKKPKHTVHIQHVYHQGPVLSFDFLQIVTITVSATPVLHRSNTSKHFTGCSTNYVTLP